MPVIPAAHRGAVGERFRSRAPVDPDQRDGADARSIGELRSAADHCRRCPLFRNATRTVFGEGPETARIFFVGEQPGDQEDLTGKPFVGPAGRMLDAVLEEAGVDRSIVYVTNAVKHFKFEPRGKRRIHSRPNAGEISACRWWLDRELGLVRPDIAVALGATAAQSLLGKPVAVTKMRGETITREDGLRVFVTVHPSYLLRIRDDADKRAERARFLDDMRKVRKLMAG
jgi:DNA polymerase